MAKMKTLTINGVRFQVVDDESVHHTPQELSEEQQAQARENIEAGLPAVTEDDNGKFLRVAAGAWGAGKPSWEDLLDKPFYEEDNREVFFPEVEGGFVLHEGFGLYVIADTKPDSLIIGETYTVIWDGKEYVCTAVDASSLNDGAEMVAIGNGASFGLSGNNEPFAIATDETSIIFFVIDQTDTTHYHTFGIFKGAVTIKTLDAKFLPKPATSIDLSGFESDGKIVETFADGSKSTTVMEFDANGKPTKITDGNGNVTVLTW